MKKIAIITSRHLRAFVENMIKELQPDCQIQIMEYHDFPNMAEIYTKMENQADAFMVSGSAAMAFLKKTHPHSTKPIVSFHADTVSLYRVLLDVLLQNRELDTNRVILDFLLPVNEDASVQFLLDNAELDDLSHRLNAWLESSTMQDFATLEREMAQKAIDLWNAGKIDLVLCNYSSIMPILEENHVPCQYVYTSKGSFRTLFHTLAAQLKLDRISENLPSAIVISDLNTQKSPESQQRLLQAILEIKKQLLLDAIVQEENGRFYLFTSAEILSGITNKLERGCFHAPLLRTYGIETAVGFGIGYNIVDAKSHADTALKESYFYKGCFLLDETNQLRGPLNSDQCIYVQAGVTDQVLEIAEKCRLSTMTVQKVISVAKMLHTDTLTTQELSERLDIAVRNAQRILTNLEKGGAATIAFTQSPTSKGRPRKVYRLTFLSALSGDYISSL